MNNLKVYIEFDGGWNFYIPMGKNVRIVGLKSYSTKGNVKRAAASFVKNNFEDIDVSLEFIINE